MKELRALAARWRVHYKAVRPHSLQGYRSPAPATWLSETSKLYGKVESKERLPLSLTPDYCDGEYQSHVALHYKLAGTKNLAGKK